MSDMHTNDAPAYNSHPRGLPYIIGNEAAERFSYYGMKGILIVFMTTGLMTAQGAADSMTEQESVFWYHIFTTGNYVFPIIGALIADIFLGKYRTVLYLSLVYCFGHLALALDTTRLRFAVGLSLVALGPAE